ncbi:hypothetical protein EXIGLDRAFT_429763 [Exidia glandulosa HHB12029]|uniref:Uncharacterized protein n=1 Tax=Exidia glandulosa HHB12029 TaxID=1314781 RepID=A0A165BBA7_EXIGL|nr:hypothetical protein EXIGLDRAFT_429763 [Exidia glandulosa HHB12029]
MLPVQVLWEQEVSPGPHVVKITNLEDKPVTVASFIYRPLSTTVALSASSSSTSVTIETSSESASPSPTTTGKSGTPMPPAAVVALAVSITAVVCTAMLLVAILRRRSWHVNATAPAKRGGKVLGTHLHCPHCPQTPSQVLLPEPPIYSEAVVIDLDAAQPSTSIPM